MKYKQTIKILLTILVGAVLIAVDLITKAWAQYTNVHQSKFFLGIVRLWYTTNDGIAFGIASDNPVVMAVITAFTIVLIVGITVVAFTVFRKNTPARTALAVIIAGAIGNLVDRLVLGTVRDFVDVSPIHFGVCNIADFCITFGAVVLIFIILFIGPSAAFPLTKKWREESKRMEEEKERKKLGLPAEQETNSADALRAEMRSGEIAPEEECVFRRENSGLTVRRADGDAPRDEDQEGQDG